MPLSSSKHIPVLLDEVLEYMDLKGDELVVDGTINGAGHAFEIAKRLDEGILVGIDLDESALKISREKLSHDKIKARVFLVRANFKDIDSVISNLGFSSADRIFFDLGWSTNQFEDAERGFSFREKGPLKMILSSDETDVQFNAWDIVNYWDEGQIEQILFHYANERFAKKIAKRIAEERRKGSIDDTLTLASIIETAIPRRFWKKGIHPATKTFQALRIAVNDEISSLKEGLEKSFQILRSGGRLLVISFHSLEDRVVKNFMKNLAKEGKGKILTKKGVTATEEEVQRNIRSRSARLRVIEKI